MADKATGASAQLWGPPPTAAKAAAGAQMIVMKPTKVLKREPIRAHLQVGAHGGVGAAHRGGGALEEMKAEREMAENKVEHLREEAWAK